LLVVSPAILASFQATLADFTADFLARFNHNFTSQAQPATSPAIVTSDKAISHCFPLVSISHNFFNISSHFSQSSSSNHKAGFCSTNSFSSILAFVASILSSEFASNLSFV
jgi:hypothetical protein